MPSSTRRALQPPPRAAYEKIMPPPSASFVLRRVAGRRFEAAYHYHPEIELTWIERSSGHRFVGDSVAPFSSGDLVLLGAKLPHVWLNPPGCHHAEAVVLQFLPEALGAIFFDLPELREVSGLLARARRGLVFSKAAREAAAERIGRLLDARGAARIALLIEILDRLAGDRGARELCSARYASAVPSGEEPRIDAVYRHLMANFRETLFQADVARQVGMHPATFSRFFRRCTGRSFTRTLNDVRLGEAAELLRSTDRGVAEVCYACGFENLANFNRQFRARHGMPPREWRKLARKASQRVGE